MTGTCVAESLIMQNLTRFLRLGIGRLMGKNTPKSDKNTLRYDLYFAAGCVVSLDSRSSI